MDTTEKEKESDFRRDIWAKLLEDEKEGKKISEQDKRALAVRRLCLDIAETLTSLVLDPSPDTTAEKEAELTAQLWDTLYSLKEQGIRAGMYMGDPPESFNSAPKMAEYVGGQILDSVQKNPLPTPAQISPQLQEFTEELYLTAPNQVSGILESQHITPTMTNFIQISGIRNITNSFLYRNLDYPIGTKEE